MGHADNTKAAYHVMQGLNVSLYDLELWGIIEARADELTTTPEAAFDRLVEDGFSLGDSNDIEHYYQATADYVYDALDERNLIKDEEDDGPEEPAATIARLRAVERGEIPSFGPVAVTGPNSLLTPGPDCTCTPNEAGIHAQSCPRFRG